MGRKCFFFKNQDRKPVTPPSAKSTEEKSLETTISETDMREDPENKNPQQNRQTKDLGKDGDVLMSDNQQVGERSEREKAQIKK